MLKLKLQYVGHLKQRAISFEKSDAGKDWGQEEKGKTEDEIVGWITDSMDMSLSKLWEMVKDWEAWVAAVQVATKSWIWLSNWATTVVFQTPYFLVHCCLLTSKFSSQFC